MTPSGASVLAAALAAAGTRHLFTLSGNQIMPLYDHLVAAGIEIVHTRHEAAAVHMADAYARLTERPCPVLLTAGPGHANALGALYVASMAESPVVLLSGRSEMGSDGLGAFQEMDQPGLARRVGKAAWSASDPNRLGSDLARAYRTADAGTPGPVSLSLPADVLKASASAPSVPAASAFRTPRRGRETDVVAAVRGAKRPLVLAGPANARGERWRGVQRLAAALGAPAVPMESPRGANDPALGGVRTILPRADVVVLAGRKLDFALGYGRPPLFAPDVRFVALPGGLPNVAETLPGDAGWRAEVEASLELGREGWEAQERSDARPIHPLRLTAAVHTAMGTVDVLISDGGEVGQWAQAGVRRTDRVINGPSGAIGGALPFAIGARLARPAARIVAFSGDGAIGYHISELETAVRVGTPFVLVVGNDQRWNAEVVIQRNLGGPELRCLELGLVRYDEVARAFGAHGELVEDPAALEGAIHRAQASGKPALLNVLTAAVPAPTYNPARGLHAAEAAGGLARGAH